MTTSIEAALVTRLKGSTTLAALVGTRIGPLQARQNWAMPYVVLYGERTTEREIATGRSVGIAQWTGSIEIHAEYGPESYESVKNIANAVRNRIDGYRGTVSVTQGESIEAVEIRTCIMETQSDQPTPAVDGGEQGRAVQVLQFSVGFFESIPTPT